VLLLVQRSKFKHQERLLLLNGESNRLVNLLANLSLLIKEKLVLYLFTCKFNNLSGHIR